MEILLEIIIQPLLQIVFLGVGYLVGFFPVLIGSLGTIEPGPVNSAVDGGVFYRSKGMKFWHLTFVDRGKRFLPAETVALAGWVILATAGTVIWAIIQIAVC